jgi:5-formyltetrahydrofolate cyclo-ligase
VGLETISEAKQAVRQRIWDLLEREGAAPAGVHGHIPDFVGKEEAAARLADLDVWKAAKIIKCNPDQAQLPVRVRALQEGKLLYMAVPRLATPKPFYLLDPETLDVPTDEAATSEGASRVAPTTGVSEMRPVDLIVSGSVAVDHAGRRLGKGAGYADIEVALLSEARLVGARTTFVTTVHSLQITQDSLPSIRQDFGVDLIVTAAFVISCPQSRRDFRIEGRLLGDAQLEAMPAVRAHLEPEE